ncbi:MAG TPA: hypothetical protein VKP11_11880, partial [Frankiaceae bacterium]|nr:hypothetical protein [Frankiaceae bacterium]
MARAKRTARADARRRNRAAVEADLPEAQEESEAAPRRATPPSRPTGTQERVGFGSALRSAYHRADIRADLAWLPNMARSKAFWIPLAAAVAAAAAWVVAPSALTYTLMQYLVWA